MKTRKRFLSDYWDSIQQRHLFDMLGKDQELRNMLIGRLRLDTLLSENIVLTDAMLMDGQFFLFSDPSEMKQDLLRADKDNCPIIIKARKRKVEDAVVGFIKNEKNRSIKEFSFSIIDDDINRDLINKSLPSLDYSKVNTVDDIISFFRDKGLEGLDSENFDQIVKGWRKWIKSCNENEYIVSEWDGDFDLVNQLGDKQEVLKKYSTEAAIELVNKVYENIYLRTAIEKKVNRQYKDAKKDNEKNEIVDIANWYFSSYNCTINNQHSCDSFESVFSTYDYILTPGKDLKLEESIEVPINFCEGLGALPRGAYRNLFYENANNFKSWWNEANKDSLKRALEPFIETSLKSRGVITEPSDTLKNIALISVGGVTGVLGWALGQWIGAAIGIGAARTAVPLLIDYYQKYKLKRPIENVSQRIMDIVEKREKNDTENKND